MQSWSTAKLTLKICKNFNTCELWQCLTNLDYLNRRGASHTSLCLVFSLATCFRGTSNCILSPVFFFMFTICIFIRIPDYFSDQLMSIISYLCCNVRSVLPTVISFVPHSNSLKLDPIESVLDPVRPIKRYERLSI